MSPSADSRHGVRPQLKTSLAVTGGIGKPARPPSKQTPSTKTGSKMVAVQNTARTPAYKVSSV